MQIWELRWQICSVLLAHVTANHCSLLDAESVGAQLVDLEKLDTDLGVALANL